MSSLPIQPIATPATEVEKTDEISLLRQLDQRLARVKEEHGQECADRTLDWLASKHYSKAEVDV